MPKNFKHRPLFANTLSKNVTQPKVKWQALPIIWLALKRTAMVLGFFVLFNVLLSVFLVSMAYKNTASVLPSEMVLVLTFDTDLQDVPPQASFTDPFAPAALTVRDIVDALDAAAADRRVKGLVAQVKGGRVDMAHAAEIRGALKRFKAAGKFAYIYGVSYEGLGEYYLASAFDEIWMQPLGTVAITGLNAEVPFARDVFDKIGVSPEFFQRKDYKTAYESFTDSQMSAENRETYTRLIQDIREEILSVVPAERGIERWSFGALVDQGLFTGRAALKSGLITHLDYADVLEDKIKEKAGGAVDDSDDVFVGFNEYALARVDARGGDKVALVYVTGAIMQNADGGGVPGAQGVAAADMIAPALMNAADDDDIKAVVMRVDSPGGSPVASETILRAVEAVRDAGKPVIVSMGPTAASGGYWVAAYADEIFVLPTTLTGSIGVVGGKFALGGLWEKLGVNWDQVRWGDNAGLWSMNSKFSAGEAEQINAMLDDVYDAFTQRVARGRGMDAAAVEALAQGQVWTGARAVENGLADQIGGLSEALDFAASEIGLDGREDLDVVVLPKPKTALEEFLALIEGQAAIGRFVQSYAGLFEPFGAQVARINTPRDFVTYERFTLQ